MSHRRSEPAGSLRLAGRVVDATGQGVASARVWIDSLPVHTVTSDRDGMFELESLLSRSYEVRAQAGS
jgi:Carboxypeptidase regulatory-like domain